MTLSGLPFLPEPLTRAQTSLKVRITWAPFTAPLKVEALEVRGVALTPSATFFGGEVEFPLPVQVLGDRPRLRWELQSNTGIDETRVEVCDISGRWHLLGELLGPAQGPWAGERTIHPGLPLGLEQGWGGPAPTPCKNAS